MIFAENLTSPSVTTHFIQLINGLLGGLVVALVNHFFTRGKTKAETDKLNAEAGKIKAETEKVLAELTRFNITVQQSTEKLSGEEQRILYDGTKSCIAAHFQIHQDHLYGERDDAPRGEGSLTVNNGLIDIRRTNTAGRFRLQLRNYQYETISRFLPASPVIEGDRKLKLRLDVKVSSGSHTIRFGIKEMPSGTHLAMQEQTFTNKEWKAVEFDFRVAPDKACELWLDDQNVTVPSNLQLRSLVLSERAF